MFNMKIKEFFDYREAIVEDPTIELELSEKDELFFKHSVHENGYTFSNHISILTTNGIAITYSDSKLYIGTKIKKGSW